METIILNSSSHNNNNNDGGGDGDGGGGGGGGGGDGSSSDSRYRLRFDSVCVENNRRASEQPDSRAESGEARNAYEITLCKTECNKQSLEIDFDPTGMIRRTQKRRERETKALVLISRFTELVAFDPFASLLVGSSNSKELE